MNHSDEHAAQASLAKDEYLVAVKILLRDGDKLLIIRDQYGEWDVPGGRIRRDQFDVALEDVLADKLPVEIGSDVKYWLGEIKTTMRVQRKEVGRDGAIVRIFAVGYEAQYLGGEVQLGEYFERYAWIDLKAVDLEDYATPSGWITQLKEYQQTVAEETGGSSL